jgi:hypothetical protein
MAGVQFRKPKIGVMVNAMTNFCNAPEKSFRKKGQGAAISSRRRP